MQQAALKYDMDRHALVAVLSFLALAVVFEPLAVLGALATSAILIIGIVRPNWILYLLLLTLPLQGTLVLTYRANIKVSELLGCVLILAVAFRFLVWKEGFSFHPSMATPLLVFTVVVIVSTLNTTRFRTSMVLNQYMELGISRDSPDARSYITALWGIYCALLLGSLPTVLNHVEKAYTAFRALVWSGFATAVFGIFQWVRLLRTDELYELPGSIYHLDVIHSSSQGFPRSPSTFTEPSLFASYMILILPITLALAVGRYPRIIGRKLALLLFTVEAFSLLLSFSVSGFVLFLITLALFLYMATSRVAQGKLWWMLRRAIVCGIALLLIVSFLQSVGVYPADVGEFVLARLVGQADSAQQRFGLAKIGWEMAKDHFLTGVGIGNFPFLAMSYGAAHSVVLMQFIFPTPSNLYILFLAELGVPGLAVFGWLLLGIYRFLLNASKKISPEFRLLQIGLCTSMAGALLTFVFLDNLFVNYVWIILGMSVALYQVGRKSTSSIHS
ncbi:MAG TPA: O-antigen ligase family protein [Terriglobales bacterium]|jgi:O-antigen ligase